MPTILLIAGLLFPIVSLLTVICSLLHQWRFKKYSSPVMIPLLGPILLSCWVVVAEQSIWLIPVFWIADVGTVAFLAISPLLVRDWWRVSWFTRTITLHGSRDIQTATITLHSTGNYLLKKSWKRPAGEMGIVAVCELGMFSQADGQYELTAHHGLHRILRKTNEGAYTVEEERPKNADAQDYTLNGWLLKS